MLLQSLTIVSQSLKTPFPVFPDNGLNPHYANSRADPSMDKSYHPVCGRNMRTFMDKCNFELAGLFYPYAK